MSATPPLATMPGDQLQPLLRLARRMLRFWRPGVLAFACTLAAAAAVAALWPKQYQSEAVVYYREGLQWDASEASNPRRVGQRLRDVLLSRTQLAKVIEELGLYPKLVRAGRMNEAAEEMRLATGFRSDQSDVFVVSYVGDSPEQAQRVTARLAELLMSENTRLRAEQAELAKGFLDAEKKRKGDDLASKEAEQLRFLARHPEFAFEQGNAIGATLRARRPEAGSGNNPAVAALLREEMRLRRQLSAGARASPQETAALAAKHDAEVKLSAARRDLVDRQNRFTEQHPDVRAAAARVAELEATYKRAVDALPPGAASAPAVPRAEIEERLQRVLQEIALARETAPARSPIPGPLLETSETAKRIVAVEAEWARLAREVAEARERLARLDTEQFKAAMNASLATTGQNAQIVVIDPAYLPARPLGMSLKKKLLVLLGLAFSVGFGLVFFRAVTDDLVCDAEDAGRLAAGPVLVTVASATAGHGAAAGEPAAAKGERPAEQRAGAAAERGRRGDGARGRAAAAEIRALPPRTAPGDAAASVATALARSPTAGAKTAIAPFATELSPQVRVHPIAPAAHRDAGIVMLAAPDSPAAASFRILRHRLAARPEAKTILVTSPAPGEGKTWTALNLALALGEGGAARVLLVEANLRTPALARLLGFEPAVCLSEQLELHRTRLTAPWDVTEAAPCLHVVAAAPEPRTRPMLDGRALAICLEQLRHAGYDHVVVDSPSILESADVNVIEESVDGIVLTLRARRSRGHGSRKAIEQIGSGKLLGVVLIDA